MTLTPTKTLTQEVVEDWLNSTEGWFTTMDLDRDLNILSSEGKRYRRTILSRLKADGKIVGHHTKHGTYRRASEDAPVIEWWSDTEQALPLRWPFGLENLVYTYPKSITVIAGAPNAGKSAFLFDFIAKNMMDTDIVYFSSEMGPTELRSRLSKREVPDGLWKFEARSRNSHFADVIRPDAINIIDFLEIADSFYMVADEIREIYDKLNKGIAIIALQKKIGANLGRGAEFSLEKPRLYLSMDKGMLTVVKAKNWVNAEQNPNGRKFTFKLVNGCRFVNIQESFGQ